MPDYQFNTQLTPNVQQTSLGDMLNLARGVQAYQQAQQVNPLEVEAKQIAIQQAKEMNPMLLAEQATRVKKGKFEYSAQQTQALNDIAGGILNDPRLNSKNPKEITSILSEAKDRASALFEDDPDGENKINGVFQPLMKVAISKPELTPQIIKSMVQQGLGATGQQTLQSGGTVEINGVKYYMNPATRQLEQLGAAGTAEQPAKAGEAAPTTAGAPTGATPTFAKDIRNPGKTLILEDMPISGGNVLQLNKQQLDRYEAGNKLIEESGVAGQNAQESKQSIRKINEYINKAAGSAPGQTLRKAGKWLFGDAETEMLMKNLADQQLRMANAMGVPTNMARETSDMASGSADITPKALKGVVDRADAMNTAVDEFRSGLKKYVDNRGALNGTIHANKFQQAWRDNYDVRVFLAKNIQDSNMSAAEKDKARRELLSGMSQKEMKELQEKATNIENLMKGGIK